jgi:hypothetical protein
MSASSHPEPSVHPSPRGRSGFGRRWIPFFVVLGILAVVGVALPIVYNLNQQLRPAQLAEARARWKEQGLRNYDLEYSLTLDRDPQPERNVVLVRDGRVVFAVRDGEVVQVEPDLGFLVGPAVRAVVTEGGPAPSVDAIFEQIQEVLSGDPEAGRRNLAVAVFDPRLGYPRRFVHRVRGTSHREEWVLRVYPAGELSVGRGGRPGRSSGE